MVSFVVGFRRRGLKVKPPNDRTSPGDEREEGVVGLAPPEGGYELYRHKNAEGTKTKGWHGYYWARKNGAGDYEIRSAPSSSTGERSMPGGVLPKEGFEEHYERAHP